MSPGNAAASITTVSPADAGSHLCYLHVVVDRYSTCPAGPWCVRCHRFGDLLDRFSSFRAQRLSSASCRDSECGLPGTVSHACAPLGVLASAIGATGTNDSRGAR